MQENPLSFAKLRTNFTQYPASQFHGIDFPSDMLEGLRETTIYALQTTPLSTWSKYYDQRYRDIRIRQWQEKDKPDLARELSYRMYANRLKKLEPHIGPTRDRIWEYIPTWQPVLYGQIASFAVPEIIAEAKIRQPTRYEEDRIESNFSTVLNRISVVVHPTAYEKGSYSAQYGDPAEIKGEHDAATLGHTINSAHNTRSRYQDDEFKQKHRISDIAIAYQTYEIMRAAEFLFTEVYSGVQLTEEQKELHYMLFRETLHAGEYRFPDHRAEMEQLAQQVDATLGVFPNHPRRFKQAQPVVERFHRFFGKEQTHLLREFLRPNTGRVFEAAIGNEV